MNKTVILSTEINEVYPEIHINITEEEAYTLRFNVDGQEYYFDDSELDGFVKLLQAAKRVKKTKQL